MCVASLDFLSSPRSKQNSSGMQMEPIAFGERGDNTSKADRKGHFLLQTLFLWVRLWGSLRKGCSWGTAQNCSRIFPAGKSSPQWWDRGKGNSEEKDTWQAGRLQTTDDQETVPNLKISWFHGLGEHQDPYLCMEHAPGSCAWTKCWFKKEDLSLERNLDINLKAQHRARKINCPQPLQPWGSICTELQVSTD